MPFHRSPIVRLIAPAAFTAIMLMTSASAPPAHAQSKKATQKAQACSFLATDEIGKVVGKPALSTMELPLSADMGTCTYYSDAAKAIPLVSTQVHLKEAKMHYSLYCETNKGGVTPGEPIAGLGDQACLRDKATLFVRKGDKLIMITIAKMGNTREPLVNLAKIALSKM